MSEENDYNKELQSKEGTLDSNENNKISNLGKVDSLRGRTGQLSQDDPEVKKLNETLGYIRLETADFPSGGRFYRDDLTIMIRAAKVGEIRDYSMIDETNMKDVDDKLNAMLISCTRIMFGDMKGSYKDILEEDRIFLILKIRELSFKEGENKLVMPIKKRNCIKDTCDSQKNVDLHTRNLQFEQVDDSLEKYYDINDRCFKIQTRDHGVIVMAPPTIGVMRAVAEYVRTKEESGESYDKSSLQLLPYLVREWRGLNNKEIFTITSSYNGWNQSKYSLIFRLAEMLKVGIKQDLVFSCESCGAEVTAPLTFPGGAKALFIVSDITSELL